MAIPSRAEQARKVAEWLEFGAEEGEDLDRFAGRIVDAFHEMLKSGLKGPTERLETGTAFKSPLSSKPYWVAWQDADRYWLTQADSNYGWLINKGDTFFEMVTPSTAKTGKPGTNKDGWKVDDVVSAFQGSLRYRIVAVHDRGVLLASLYGEMEMPDSNENMARYYTKESR
jgi:hypothetical protein